jgi:hypothetical protein
VENAYGPGTWFPLVPVFFVISLALSLAVCLAMKRRTKPAIAPAGGDDHDGALLSGGRVDRIEFPSLG